MLCLRLGIFVFAFLLLNASGVRLGAAEADVNTPASDSPTEDALTAMRKFRVAPGLKVDLFGAEPMIQNVVSFAFDEKGRCYVVESHRRRTSVFDIRNFPEWLESDFSLRTVEDRASFFKTTLTPANQPALDKLSRVKRGFLPDLNGDGVMDWRDLEVESERIRLLVDTNSDGRADAATTLAEGFNGITSGVAAGVLARKGDVWFTCIPDIWKLTIPDLRFTSGIPSSDSLPLNPHVVNRKSKIEHLAHGFGVHIALGGHDLHGLKMGPDGKIYFSVADRGTSTNLWDKIVDHWPGLTMEALADSGAVFRCNPDGTELEVIAIGLRNPQELAFDELGNLFTGDNNGDGGDKSRWEYIVEGADYGWRIGWQWLPKMGAWNSEMLWGMAPSNTSSYYLPPVTHIAAGPAGMAYYPGTGLPARYDRHFLLCDFRGGPNSLVYSFALRPKGASFEAYDESEFINGFLCTDVEFGPDGAVYVSDWVKGWEKSGKGRIYRVFDPGTINDPMVLEVKKLLADGFEKRSNEELARLLGHRDMRVRLEAQWTITAKNFTDSRTMMMRLQKAPESAIAEGTNQLARIHSIWSSDQINQAGLGLLKSVSQVPGPTAPMDFVGMIFLGSFASLRAQISDSDPEIRAQVAKALGHLPLNGSDTFLGMNSVKTLLPMLKDSSHRVRFLAAQSLGMFRSKEAIPALIDLLRDNKNEDAYLRHAAVFALARIGDVPALLAAAKDSSPSVRMGVCLALRRLQRPEIAQFLNDSDPKIALEAARAINDVPIPEAMPGLAKLSNETNVQGRAASHPYRNFVLRRALNANFRLGQAENAARLSEFALSSNAPEALRAEAIELLALWPKPPGRDRVVGLWRPLPSRDISLAANALKAILPTIDSSAPSIVPVAAKKAAAELGLLQGDATTAPSGADRLARFSAQMRSGSLAEKQSALAGLASPDDAAASSLLSAWLDKLVAGAVPRELQLDVIESVQKSPSLVSSTSAQEKLSKFEAARDAKDALAKWRECLYGGDAEEGKKVFVERQDLACFRCHKINGEGGEVGPELAGIGSKQSREYLLESILFPNKAIAPGFESVLVTLKDGTSYAGVLKSENETQLVINSPEDGLLAVKKADIQTRDRGLSAMPEEMGNTFSKSDLRNLLEFLATLK